jgi:superfamily II DNA/RNA helicase
MKMDDLYDYARKQKDLMEMDDLVVSKDVLNEECQTFDIMGGEDGLKMWLLKGIYSYGFELPSKIQGLAIPQIIKNREIIAQSQSGTGKTGAFLISILQMIEEDKKTPQAIIITPTHELAQQIYLVGKALASRCNKVNFSFTVGKTDRLNNYRELGGRTKYKKDDDVVNVCQIIVATPGRLLDLLQENRSLFEDIKYLVLDECDELLKGTFSNDIKSIIKTLPPVKISLFSATLTTDVVELSDILLKDAQKILIKKESMTLKGIAQTYIETETETDKYNQLLKLLSILELKQMIIYVNSIKKLDFLKEKLEQDEYKVLTISGSQNKVERALTLKEFKDGTAKVLISTDLLSRGIDIHQLSIVINYDLPRPEEVSKYIHRIGRTGRFGKKGIAINLINRYEMNTLNLISLTFKCDIEPIDRSHFTIF